MESRKAKLSQFIFTELFFHNVVDLVLSGKITELSHSHSGLRLRAFQTKHFINLTISITAQSQKHMAYEMQFQCLAFLVSESEIQHFCKLSHVS